VRTSWLLALLMSVAAGSPGTAAPARPAITGISHIAVYTSDPNAAERFYVHDLGAVKGADPEDAHGTRYNFSTTQFIEVLPLPHTGNSIQRLDHVAFTTADADALRSYLGASGIRVPASVQTAGGSRWFEVRDPEGNRIQFVEPGTHVTLQPSGNAISHHIIHVGFIVHDRTREDGFFRTVLGFRPYWYGGNEARDPTWISQQVPDGSDWLEYMLVAPPDGRGIPAGMSQSLLGVFNHFSLGIGNMEAAYTQLWNGDRLTGQKGTPKIGRDAKWQLNLQDPDGTRAELMELHAIGTPCCSLFTAPDPVR
jgi:catechol 2,3-dioxygenase-like lactoylglutathione lyase family enzyme